MTQVDDIAGNDISDVLRFDKGRMYDRNDSTAWVMTERKAMTRTVAAELRVQLASPAFVGYLAIECATQDANRADLPSSSRDGRHNPGSHFCHWYLAVTTSFEFPAGMAATFRTGRAAATEARYAVPSLRTWK